MINIDETTVQVLDEPGRSATQKSYIWVFRGGSPGNPVVIYQYHKFVDVKKAGSGNKTGSADQAPLRSGENSPPEKDEC